jgi:hypothetical protein
MKRHEDAPREVAVEGERARTRRSVGAAGLAAVLGLVTLAWSQPAHADLSSWLYVGGGAGLLDTETKDEKAIFQVDTGIGSNPGSSVVIGGLFRGQALFGSGLDLGLLSRVVTGEFVRGGFGGGLDLGMYQRWWGEGSTGFTGNVVLGGPWGLTLSAGGSVGTNDQRLIFASLGFDFARLTVHRHTGLDWFANPMRSPGD